MMKRYAVLTSLLGFVFFINAQKPNIIYIMADDLGYGELGCYGQQKIKTPHIDKLAGEGMRFTQFYATTLCASTRCSFVTGLSGAHALVRDNHELGGYTDEEEFGQMPLSANTITVATELKKAGYRTALIGKWGLGGPGSTGVPNKQGFDFFYGYLDQKQAHNFYPSHLWRNEKAEWLQSFFPAHQKFSGDSTNPKDYAKYKGKIFSQDTMAAEAVKFIDNNKNKPFFLYLAFTLPHLALQVPDEELKQYQNLFDEKPYNGSRGYLPHFKPRSAYAAMISTLDKYVGMVMEALKKNGLDKNTLVIFTSDNGPTAPGTGGADTDFFKSNGDLRGYKGSLYEGGIRVPFIARWPEMIKQGSISNDVYAAWDMMKTFCELGKTKTEFFTDGISLLPALTGKAATQHDFLYWEVHGYANGIQAIRWKNWKALKKGIHKNLDAEIELYDLNKDETEQDDVSAQNPEVILKIKQLLNKRSRAVIKEWNF
jgi:arylsulfatase A-like enzyme